MDTHDILVIIVIILSSIVVIPAFILSLIFFYGIARAFIKSFPVVMEGKAKPSVYQFVVGVLVVVILILLIILLGDKCSTY